jgi:hypothetical protein
MELQESIDLDDAGQCLCGRPSTEGGAEDENFGLQVCHHFKLNNGPCRNSKEHTVLDLETITTLD